MILISRTYSEVTPESAKDGENSDDGFICQDESYTFRELVRLLRDHPEASAWPITQAETWVWFSTGYHVYDYSTGIEREECVHYSHKNHPRSAKYWSKAAKAAGIV